MNACTVTFACLVCENGTGPQVRELVSAHGVVATFAEVGSPVVVLAGLLWVAIRKLPL